MLSSSRLVSQPGLCYPFLPSYPPLRITEILDLETVTKKAFQGDAMDEPRSDQARS